MSSPRVSVIIPSYNHEKYIKECIESVLTQTYSDTEILVIDDASKDNTPEILKGYENGIRLILHDTNRGTYKVLNEGLSLAKGEYCAILNSDDVWLPKKLELQVHLMDAHPEYVFCHTYGKFIDQNGKEIPGRPMGFEFPRVPSGDILPRLVTNNCVIASSVLLRVEIARTVCGFDESFRNLGDWDMWLRLAEQGEVGFVDEVLTLYRVHGENTIYQKETTRKEEIRIREALLSKKDELLRKSSQPREMRHALAHTAACLGTLYSITGKPREARQVYLEALRLYPLRAKTWLRYLLTFAPLWVRQRTL
ncbi:MAG TPA: glycosyltransferase [Fimbriimonadales bacterium]|nr:glycosyltransferase [Fimbriimonadales bacterium]